VRILDLFCGAGGAAMGYHRAFPDAEIVGVDINPQPRYPFTFVQADAMTYPLDGFDFIHASPPCQGYSRMNHVHKRAYPMLIAATRHRLRSSGAAWTIENVEGAPLIDPITLCGTMFGLAVLRHRLFESSFDVPAPRCGSHDGEFYAPTGHGAPNRANRARNPHLRGVGYTDRCRAAMGIDWMNRDELAEAIPPAYTEHIGNALAAHLMERAA
jgi:DNA (cytosine-5)-methyltransferase 1